MEYVEYLDAVRRDGEVVASKPVKRAIRTNDCERAASMISTNYEPTLIEAPPRGGFVFGFNAAKLECVTAGRLEVRTLSRVFGGGPADVYHICAPLSGQVLCRGAADGPQTVRPGQASLWAPGQVPDTVWAAETTQVCLMIPRAVVDHAMASVLGTDCELPRPIRFAPVMDLKGAIGRSWRQLLDLLSAELIADSGLLEHGTPRQHLERLLIDGLVLGHPHAYSDRLHLRGRPAPTGAAAQVVELIEEDPASPWTVLELARRVHVSVRALQETFQRKYGTTPMNYLRRTRLQRVRQELLAATDDPCTVRSVGQRWGFTHLGRFSGYYKKEFGELPSETLRRIGAPATVRLGIGHGPCAPEVSTRIS